jgi:hypothetical protein
MKYEEDFIRGARDCQQGNPHKPLQSEAYDKGYGTQYEHDQINTEITKCRTK